MYIQSIPKASYVDFLGDSKAKVGRNIFSNQQSRMRIFINTVNDNELE
jgi:hypothetical protein